MSIIGVYLIGLVAFLAIDAVWLTAVMRPLFERNVGELLREQMVWGAAAGFYVIYVAGIIYFCTMPGLRADSVALAGGHGLLLGFLAYGTYEFTNMTTLKGWDWSMVVTDTAWGMALTGTTAVITLFAARGLGMGAA